MSIIIYFFYNIINITWNYRNTKLISFQIQELITKQTHYTLTSDVTYKWSTHDYTWNLESLCLIKGESS